MNILVALDSNYINALGVMLHSVSVTNPGTAFDIYVAHSSLTQKDFDVIDRSVDLSRFTIHPVRVPDDMLKDAPIMERTSKETYYRLLAVDYLPPEVDRIMYLDPDIAVINRLDDFYNIDFKGNYLAAAEHVGPWLHFINRVRFRMDRKTGHYVNAGVMMMNLEAMRKTESVEKVFDYIKNTKIKLYLADQDVINGMYNRKTINVDPRIYNLDEKTYRLAHKADPSIDLDWVEKNTVIVHFNGPNKPWKTDVEYEGELADFYFRFVE